MEESKSTDGLCSHFPCIPLNISDHRHHEHVHFNEATGF